MENKNEVVLAVIVFLGLFIGGGSYLLWQNSQKIEEPSFVVDPSSSNNGGTVSLLGQTPAAQEPTQEVQGAATDTSTKPEEKQVLEDNPYILKLPSGWSLEDSKVSSNSCDESSVTKTDTYKRGAETLVVYENGHPDGCVRTSAADVYLDYKFTDDQTGIKVDTTKIEQCSKEDNSVCPKGDGKVSLYIGNESAEDPTKLRKNTKTGNTYFFVLTDTKVDPSLESQIRGLVKIVESIKFE